MSRTSVALILLASTLAAYIGAVTYPEPVPIVWADYAPGGGL